jgi:hypothetical protein
MIFAILLIMLIVLVCFIIGSTRRKSTLTDMQIEQLRQQNVSASTPAAAPSAPTEDKYDRLTKAKGLLDAGVLTQEEFERERTKILGQ